MKIVVCVKQTFDTEAKIVINNGKIDKQGVSLIVNPYDEYAVEEGLKIKESLGGEVAVVGVGEEDGALRQALAMGADNATLVSTGIEDADEYTTAVTLAKAISGMEYDIILMGLRAVDDGSAQVAGRVAEILGIPVVNMVTKLEVSEGKVVATCDIDGGTQVVEVALPAVFTAQKGLNEPRYPSMKGIMKAKRKPMKKIGLGDLGLDAAQVAPKVKIVSCSLPTARAAGKMITGEADAVAGELAKALRDEAKVI